MNCIASLSPPRSLLQTSRQEQIKLLDQLSQPVEHDIMYTFANRFVSTGSSTITGTYLGGEYNTVAISCILSSNKTQTNSVLTQY